ncbi:MAG: polyribonucleotide nucleotidyltransferase, partial [Vicinamibacterales bacterium]
MHKRDLSLGSQSLSIETGRLAKQADGAVIVRMGDTMVLVTACHSSSPREGIDFLPLTVDYREYTYASGRIPGGFFKREGKATEKETLTSRVIDRPIRPLFPSGWAYETQVIAFVLSADTENDSDVLALTGAGAALALSEMPVEKTVAAVRVGLVDGEYIVNPTFPQRKNSRLDLVVAGTADGIVMVEAGANEVSEDEAIQALETAHKAIKQLVEMIDGLAKEAGRKKLPKPEVKTDEKLSAYVESKAYAALNDAMRIKGKIENYGTVAKLEKDLVATLPEEFAAQKGEAKALFHGLQEKALRESILNKGIRLDGRKFDEIRQITIENTVLPRVHGSCVFTRGETQALVTVTLGTADDQQKIEMVDGETWKRFMLHYNFPPFSVGEVKPMRGPGRREIGHGALAERALAPMMPTEAEFAYTVRVVSDILESNGSSSMASVCGGSMAMMDAGVPIKSAVAGVAMGLIMDEASGKYAVLSDIAGAEDHYGDMDFKVAGTAAGITALQMDIKVTGISSEVMRAALTQAKAGRMHILGIMNEALSGTREKMSA